MIDGIGCNDVAGFSGWDASAPDATSPSMVVFILWMVWFIVMLVVSILVVDDLVIMMMLVVFNVIPDLECTRQSVDGCNDQEFGHEQSLDHHQ